jgi:hypothetical protein
VAWAISVHICCIAGIEALTVDEVTNAMLEKNPEWFDAYLLTGSSGLDLYHLIRYRKQTAGNKPGQLI